MDRLTYRDPGEFGLARISANYFNHHEPYTKDETITGLAPERLAAYEDTGLTPDEVVELVEKYNQLVIDYDRLYYHMQDLDAEAQYQAYENGQ